MNNDTNVTDSSSNADTKPADGKAAASADNKTATAGSSGAGTPPQSPSTQSSTASGKPASKPTQAKSTPVKSSKKSGGWGGKLFMLILLAVLAVAGWFSYNNWPHVQKLVSGDISFSEMLSASTTGIGNADNDVEGNGIDSAMGSADTVDSGNSNTGLTALREELGRLEQRLNSELGDRAPSDAVMQRLDDLELALNGQAGRIKQLSSVTRTDWMLAEAEYLVRLGNQRLVTERNNKNALALLLSADEIIKDIDAVDLLPVRKALAEDIVALRSVDNIDREGLNLRLEALSKQVANLSLLAPAPEMKDSPLISDVDETAIEQPSWQERLSVGALQVWNATKDLIRVRRRNAPVDPILSEDEERLVRLRLDLILEQAQIALMRGNAGVYTSSLASAQGWVEKYFQMNDGQAANIVEQLGELAAQKVSQPLPDISSGLNALRDYIDRWHNRHEVHGDSRQSLEPAVSLKPESTPVEQPPVDNRTSVDVVVDGLEQQL